MGHGIVQGLRSGGGFGFLFESDGLGLRCVGVLSSSLDLGVLKFWGVGALELGISSLKANFFRVQLDLPQLLITTESPRHFCTKVNNDGKVPRLQHKPSEVSAGGATPVLGSDLNPRLG